MSRSRTVVGGRLMVAEPQPGATAPAMQAGIDVLRGHVHAVTAAGRLRVTEELAVQLVHASGSGTVFALLAVPEEQRDLALSHLAREACLAAITTDEAAVQRPGPVGAAAALRAGLPEVAALTAAERGVLAEWLDRITDAPSRE